MGKGLHLAYDLNGISGNEKLLVGGNDPYIHLGVISRDALLAADIVSGSIHLDAQELHVGADLHPQVLVVLTDTAGESDGIHTAHSGSVGADELLDL